MNTGGGTSSGIIFENGPVLTVNSTCAGLLES